MTDRRAPGIKLRHGRAKTGAADRIAAPFADAAGPETGATDRGACRPREPPDQGTCSFRAAFCMRRDAQNRRPILHWKDIEAQWPELKQRIRSDHPEFDTDELERTDQGRRQILLLVEARYGSSEPLANTRVDEIIGDQTDGQTR